MFFGLDGNVCWFFGVVENRIDPLNLDRVQVRLFVHHPKEQTLNQKTGNGLKTEELPWAYVMGPTTSASMDGIGTNHNLVEGTHVIGISRDGNVFNDLVILGTVGGKPEDEPNDKSKKFGFVDVRTAAEIADSPRYINKQENLDPGYEAKGIPQGRYPQEKWLNESSINRLRRGEKLDQTYLKVKRDKREKDITNILGSWSELPSSYGAKYPYNNVTETECGHVIEFDDTKLKERHGFWHGGEKAEGSYFEWHPDGSYVLKSKTDIQILSDSYSLYAKDTAKFSSDNIGIDAKNNLLLKSGETISILTEVGILNISALLGVINITSTVAINATSPIINLNTKLLTVDGTIFYTAI